MIKFKQISSISGVIQYLSEKVENFVDAQMFMLKYALIFVLI